MEFIFIVGIIIAIIGILTVAAVVWQGDSKPIAEQPSVPPAVNAPPVSVDTAVDAAFASPPVTPVAAQADPAAPAVTPTVPLPPEDAPLTIESITALYAHANDGDVATVESSLRLNVANILANQIEQLYTEYVLLEEERKRLAESLLTNMLFEKIERSAGRLAITTERQTLDLREQFSKVSADYDRVQFRLGSLQHLNTRLTDPRVSQQLDELVLEIRRLASKPA